MLSSENLTKQTFESSSTQKFKHSSTTLLRIFDNLLRKAFIVLIAMYRVLFRYWISGRCRHYPTCSEYGRQAFMRFSFPKAFYLTSKRILNCRPGGSYGCDPLPEETK